LEVLCGSLCNSSHLVDCRDNSSAVFGQRYVGSAVGYAQGYSSIDNVYLEYTYVNCTYDFGGSFIGCAGTGVSLSNCVIREIVCEGNVNANGSGYPGGDGLDGLNILEGL